MLFHDGKFQWRRLRNLIALAKDGAGGLDLSDTVSDGARVLLLDAKLRTQLLLALTEDNKLHLRVSHIHGLGRCVWCTAGCCWMSHGASALLALLNICAKAEQGKPTVAGRIWVDCIQAVHTDRHGVLY